MQDLTYLSLLPPAIVLAVGFATRRIILSLVCGIIAAALLSADCNFYNAAIITFSSVCDVVSTTDKVFICIFLFILGIIVTLMRNSGGVYAYGNFVKKFLQDKRSAETASVLLSICLIIDDYLSCLTVGVVMRPLTDLYKIARVKLAFLVDTLAAPMAIACPLSSWVAAILGFLSDSGVKSIVSAKTLVVASPFSVYSQVLPFMFYSLIALVATIFIVRGNIAFGKMAYFETTALKTNDVLVGHSEDPAEQHYFDLKTFGEHNTHIIDFLIPLAILLVSVLSGMLYSGDFIWLSGNNNFIAALQNAEAATGLFIGGSSAVILITIFLIWRKKLLLNNLTSSYFAGIKLMFPAVAVLMLAWTLGDMLISELGTGQYLAGLLSAKLNIVYLPAILFIFATLISFAIGSSWGTTAMLFPIVVPMILNFYGFSSNASLEQLPMMLPALGAVLSGAVAGDHLSPISDTTVMSSTSTGTPQMDHVRTQLTYGIPFVIATIIAFLLLSITNAFIAVIIPMILLIIIFKLIAVRFAMQQS